MGKKRKHQAVQQESVDEAPKAISDHKSGSKKKRAKKSKTETLVKEASPPPELDIQSDELIVDVKPDLSELEGILDGEARFVENFADDNNDTMNTEDGCSYEPKTEPLELPTWPTHDLATLLGKIKEILPEKDNLRFKSRLLKLDWETLRFGNYSSEQCRQMWEFVQKHVRCYRLLGEILADADAWISQPWTSYRNHKKKPHPEMPRRPLTCYMIYYMRNKTKVLKKNPKMDMPSLSKHIAEMYKNLTPTKKDKYMAMAATQRDEYIKKLNEFYKRHPELEPKTTKRKIPSLNVPKKPFTLFYNSKLKDADEKVDRNLFLRKCKKKWKMLSDEQRLHWIDLALSQTGTNTDAGDEEKDEYKKKMRNLLTKEERYLKDKIAGKPDKPPLSAYGLFSRQMIASERIQAINPKDRMATVAQEWKQCTPEDKEAYKEKVIELIDQYKRDYTSYLDSLSQEERIAELISIQPKGTKNLMLHDAPISPPSPVDATTSKLSETPPECTQPEPTPPQPTKQKKKKEAVKEKSIPASNIEEIEVEQNIVPEPAMTSTLFLNEPEPPPNNPFELFAKQMLKKPHKVKISVEDLWEDLSIKDKERYRKKFDKLKNAYLVKYEKFLKSLTPEQLTQYSSMKNAQTAEESSESESDNDEESDDSEDNNDQSIVNLKQASKQNKEGTKKKAVKEESIPASNIEEIEVEQNIVPEPVVTSTLFLNEPERPPNNPFELFAKQMLKIPHKVKISVEDLWEDLSIKDKERYRKMFDKLKNAFLVKYEEFLRSLTPEQLIQYSSMINAQTTEESSESESDNDEESDDSEDNNDQSIVNLK